MHLFLDAALYDGSVLSSGYNGCHDRAQGLSLRPGTAATHLWMADLTKSSSPLGDKDESSYTPSPHSDSGGTGLRNTSSEQQQVQGMGQSLSYSVGIMKEFITDIGPQGWLQTHE